MKRDKALSHLASMFRALGVGAIVIGGTHAVGQTTFTDVTQQAGLTHRQNTEPVQQFDWMTGGAAVTDYDGDGWVDLFVTRLDQPDILYRNQGVDPSGVHRGFIDVTQQAFASDAPLHNPTPSNGAGFADVDNDGHADLYTTAWNDSRYYLYMNQGDGTFEEEARARNAAVTNPTTHYGTSVAFGDYDSDGYVDLMTGEWAPEDGQPANARLLRNRGAEAPGHFQDVTAAAGVDMSDNGEVRSFSPRFTDLDADGHPDLAVAADFGTSRLFWNNGDGTFTDGTTAAAPGPDGVGSGHTDMGSTVGDYDNDGDLDWFITDWFAGISTIDGNRLFRNESGRSFSDQTNAAGVRNGGWGWGTSFLDYDNDGDLDLTMTNGGGPRNLLWAADPMRLWQNDGQGNFLNVAPDIGLTDIGQGRGLLVFDFNNDGNRDLFIVRGGNTPILYRNNGENTNDFLRLDLTGTLSNRDAINALIRLTPDLDNPDLTLIREIDGGSNYLAHNQRIAHFGLGDLPPGTTIDQVDILWPSGRTQRLTDVMPNQTLAILEPTNVPEPATALSFTLTALIMLKRRAAARDTDAVPNQAV